MFKTSMVDRDEGLAPLAANAEDRNRATRGVYAHA